MKVCAWLAFVGVLAVGGCSVNLQERGPEPAATPVAQPQDVSSTKSVDGLDVRLSSGAPAVTGQSKGGAVIGMPLDAATTAKLLARAAPLPADPAARQSFSFRAPSSPPPRTGITVVDAFAPKNETPPATALGPLAVERYAPEGDVPIAPFVSVTFSEPMIALGSHAESVRDVPVEISPSQAGQWRWLGTRTLIFEPTVRLPMATRYNVRVLPHAKSITGQRLQQPFAFTFATPAPQVIAQYPMGDARSLTPVIFIEFDQRIDADAALANITVVAGGENVPVRRATLQEVQVDPVAVELVKRAEANSHAGRYLTLIPRAPLPKSTTVRVVVEPGIPSAEGPRVSEIGKEFSFRTFDPLAVVEARCGYKDGCRPNTSWEISFNNPIDRDTLDAESIRIEPMLRDAKITGYGNYLRVEGSSLGETRYQLTLPSTLRDQFGQTLDSEAPLIFDVDKARANAFGLQSFLSIVDPTHEPPTYSVFSIRFQQLRVRIRRVTPEDWNAYLVSREDLERVAASPRPLPGSVVFDQVVAVQGPVDRVSETLIDVSPALNAAGFGNALITVEFPGSSVRRRPLVVAWVQATAIGLDGFVDRDEFLAWTTNLADGASLAGVDLELLPHRARRQTDASGLARLPLATQFVKDTPHMLIVRRGEDVAFLPESFYSPLDEPPEATGRWFREADPDSKLVWFVYDDRKLYRPGETVNLKGWLRLNDFGKGGDLAGLNGAVPSIGWVAKDARSNELAKGQVRVNPFGGFHASFKLPSTPNLGYASVLLSVPGSSRLPSQYAHSFQIQEFRRPEFEVSVSASGDSHVVGTSTDVIVKAAYFSGGALPAGAVKWQVSSSEASFVPPNRSDYTFGSWAPWWWSRLVDDHAREQTFTAATGSDGTHELHLDFLSVTPSRAMSLTATADVTDVNRQTWSASKTLLVHPADVYVGLKRERYFVEKGKPIKLDVLVVDHEGNAVPGRDVVVQAFRREEKLENGRRTEARVNLQECRVVSGVAEQRCELATAQGGVYDVEATVTDAANRTNQTSLQVWVTGAMLPLALNMSRDSVMLIPDKRDYAAGDSARLLVQAPFFPAEALLTVRRSGVVTTQRFPIESASTVVDVPIRDAYVPNVLVQVDIVGSALRTDEAGKPIADAARRPAFATGSLSLAVPPKDRALKLAVTPRDKEVMPGGKTSVRVRVVDAAGRARPNVEVAVMVVDEAVLALADYKAPDPLTAFYAWRNPETRDLHARRWVLSARPAAEKLAAAEKLITRDFPLALRRPRPSFISDIGMPASFGGGIVARRDFSAIAAFAPEQRTDAEGVATLEFQVPDNLTRYRIIAVAADRSRSFGVGEASLTARLPLMVRPALPRFLNYGDRFELPVVLQNQTDRALNVELGVRADNATLFGANGQRVMVPAGDRVEVRFAAAAEMPGTARFQMVAVAAGWSDAAEVSLPVYTPATTEAFATYGEIDAGAIEQRVRLPSNTVPTYGGLQLTTSSTQLTALTDAFLYLQKYPYECAEQVSSRVLAVAALRDVLGQFQASGLPPKKEIEKAVARDLARLASLQTYDGGFAFWNSDQASWPYVSIHVSHALARAKQKGYQVPDPMLGRAIGYLKAIEQHIPETYPADVERTLTAYALWVRKLLGDADPASARKLLAVGTDKLSVEALGWLLGVLADDAGSQAEVAAILRRLGNQVTETAAAAHWVNDYRDGGYLLLHSSRRADAIILESLMRARPNDSLIPKVVRGLMAEQRRGHWANTQEDVFVLLAMDAYFAKYEKATPDMIARAWVGNRLATETRFAGRSTQRHHVDIPLTQLDAAGKEQPFIVGRTGKGRLYYRLGLTYAPSDLMLSNAEQGFAVERRYEAVDDRKDVRRGDDGVWHIKAGARVRVRVSMVATSRRYHVALVDPMPAGLEALNPELAATERIPSDPQRRDALWLDSWYEHQNLRDDRAEAFTSVLYEGKHEYTYVARATTPGTFVVPPAKAEEMYAPETFGRGSSDRVVIE